MCNKQSERALWICPEVHFLLTCSLNNKTKILRHWLYTLDQDWIGLWHSLFSVPQNSNVPTMRTCFLDQHPQGRTNGHKCICYINNSAQAASHCPGCMIVPYMSFIYEYVDHPSVLRFRASFPLASANYAIKKSIVFKYGTVAYDAFLSKSDIAFQVACYCKNISMLIITYVFHKMHYAFA